MAGTARLRVIVPLLAWALIAAMNCSSEKGDSASTVELVFKHGKISGNRNDFRSLLQKFEKQNPGIVIRDETLPASTDEQHQFYVINLEGGRADFDVFSMDVIWVPEFSRAGWLLDITDLFSEKKRRDFFPGPVRAVIYDKRVFAIPWYIDAGLLFYRKDILERYGHSPPLTWNDLVKISGSIAEREPQLYGFIWQGKQYEGLLCNALEYMWGNKGDVLENGTIVLYSRENIRALRFMHDLIHLYGVSPSLVTTATEEPCRHIFGNGKAVFMRNWPYAWNLFNADDSPVRGKVGVTVLPSFKKGLSCSVLGGWQLGINRHTKHPDEARRFIQFMTAPESQKALSLTAGYNPVRKSLYRDRDLTAKQPHLPALYRVFMNARPRPVTPYYMMLSQVLQPEISAIVSGIRSPEEALASASEQIGHILKAGHER